MIRAIPQPLVSPLVTSLVASPSGISGFAFPGETLTMPTGTSYQWFVNSDNRGTAQTLLLTVDDIGKTITGIRNGVVLPTKTVWKPQDVPGVRAFWWSRAGVLTGVSPDVVATDGQGVRRWVGQVSGGPADQTVTGNQPTFRATGQSGGQSLEFDGTTDKLDLSGTQLSIFRNLSNGYLFVGCRDTNPTGGGDTHWPVVFSTPAGATRLIMQTRGSNSFCAIGRRLDSDSSAFTTTTASNSNYNVLCAEALYASGVLNFRVNGSQTGTASFSSGAGTSEDTNSLSANIGNTNFPGHITCVICCNQLLSATNRSRIERFIGLHGGLNIPLV